MLTSTVSGSKRINHTGKNRDVGLLGEDVQGGERTQCIVCGKDDHRFHELTLQQGGTVPFRGIIRIGTRRHAIR